MHDLPLGDRGDAPRRPPDLLTRAEWAEIIRRLRLSPREAELVRLAFYDESVTRMAGRLGVSAHTVHTYRERVFRKLGVHSFCQVMSAVFVTFLAMERNGARRDTPSAMHVAVPADLAVPPSASPRQATPGRPTPARAT